MGHSFIDNSFNIIQPASPSGIILLLLTCLVLMADLSFLIWFLLKFPYKRQASIQWIMILLCLWCFPYMIIGIFNQFTDTPRIISGTCEWLGGIFIFGIYLLEVEILLLFRPLSPLITLARARGIQTFVIILHFLTFAMAYYAIGLVLNGATVLPVWITTYYLKVYSVGILIVIVFSTTQNIFTARILYAFISSKKFQSQAQTNFSRHLVLRYLTWVVIISTFDLVSLFLYIFGSYEMIFAVTIFVSGRLLEVIVAFDYLIQIPFKSIVPGKSLKRPSIS